MTPQDSVTSPTQSMKEMRQEAALLGIPEEDLTDPACLRYLKTRLEPPSPSRYPREPADASGFTGDMEILLIREKEAEQVEALTQ